LRALLLGSLLACGRNPKQVLVEVGHAAVRMTSEVYDSFMDPANWLDETEAAGRGLEAADASLATWPGSAKSLGHRPPGPEVRNVAPDLQKIAYALG